MSKHTKFARKTKKIIKSKRFIILLSLCLIFNFLIQDLSNNVNFSSNYETDSIFGLPDTDEKGKIIPIEFDPLPITHFVPQASVFQSNNASQYNVSETVVVKNTETELDIATQNISMNVPSANFAGDNLNVNSVYKLFNVTNNGNVTSDTAWSAIADPAYVNTYTFYFDPLSSNNQLEINTKGNKILQSKVPTGSIAQYDYSELYQNVQKFDPGINVTQGELIRAGSQDNERNGSSFTTDPSWEELQNPYGGQGLSATTDLSWNSEGYLTSYIKAGDKISNLGNPSIAWGARFNITSDIPWKTAKLYISWAVSNLYYTALDNVSVMARVDNQFVDGRRSLNGTLYSEGTSMSLETDSTSESVVSHGYWSRIYDVTSLISSYNTNHTFDFGVWMQNTNHTNAEVKVFFDNVYLRLIEEDIYKIGDIRFRTTISTSSGTTTTKWYTSSEIQNLAAYFYFGPSDHSKGYYVILGSLYNLLASGGATGTLDTVFTGTLDSRLLNYFDQPSFVYSFGLIAAASCSHDMFTTVAFDDIKLDLYYTHSNISKQQLQVLNSNFSWINVNRTNMLSGPIVDDSIQLKFRNNDSIWNNSRMKFYNEVILQNRLIHSASASYSFNSWTPSFVSWNVSYNTTETMIGLRSLYDWSNFVCYNFTIEDLPAFDNNGAQSLNWQFDQTIGPYNYNFTTRSFRSNGNLGSFSTQNLTVFNATFLFQNQLLNGSFSLFWKQINPILNASLYNTPNLIQDIFYKGNQSVILGNLTSNLYAGNYSISIYNASGNLIDDGSYLRFIPNQIGNLSTPWEITNSFGLGEYNLTILWNDTINGMTQRIGAYSDSFEIWNTTIGTLVEIPLELLSGQDGSFKVGYNQSESLDGLSGASITVFNNDTNRLWGLDFAPYQYLYESQTLVEYSIGNYSFKVSSDNVPNGNYTLKIYIQKLYFQISEIFCYFNVSGQMMFMDFTQGVIEDVYGNFLPESNIPFVNDSKTCTIQFRLENSTSPLRYATVQGVFNSSSIISYGFEVYPKTLDPDDKGIYNITLDTSGLNSTDYAQFANYTITITASLSGYAPVSILLNASVKRAPSRLSGQNIISNYEGGEIEHYIQFENILTSVSKAITPSLFSNITWQLTNDTATFTGTYTYVTQSLYDTIITLSNTPDYVYPGFYNYTIYGSAWNHLDAIWVQENLQIFPKLDTSINVTFNSEIRVGSQLIVTAKLLNSTNNPLSSQTLQLKIIYFDISFDVIGTTDSEGIVTFSQIVPNGYTNTILHVNVTYAGTQTIRNSFNNASQMILGQIPASLAWISLPGASDVQVGYSISVVACLFISGVSRYDQSITLTVYYEQGDSPVYQTKTVDENGYANFSVEALADGYANVSFIVEFSGSISIMDAILAITYPLLPKWGTNLLFASLPYSTRIGQTVSLNLTAQFVDIYAIESYYGLPVDIIFYYNSEAEFLSYSHFFDLNYQILFNFTIPQTCGSQLRVHVVFADQAKIKGNITDFIYTILPKWSLTFTLLDFPPELHLGHRISTTLHVVFTESDSSESLFDLDVKIGLNYGTYTNETSGNLNGNGDFLFEFAIPLDASSQFIMSIFVNGTSKISAKEYSFIYEIRSQKDAILDIILEETQQNYAGDFNLAVKLTDSDGIPLANEIVVFIVRNELDVEIARYSALTNSEGKAVITIAFTKVGNYYVEIHYPSENIYKSAENNGYHVRVVNNFILILDNWDKILIVAAILFGSLFTVYRTVIIPRRNRFRDAKLAMTDRFLDAENIQYVIISHLRTGLNIFSRGFTEVPIDETLVSGFLSAISSFGQELAGKTTVESGTNAAPASSGGLEELSYKQFKIFNIDSQFVRTSILLLKKATPTLKANARAFNHVFEGKYAKELEKWAGKSFAPGPILELIEEHLSLDLLYPHRLLASKVNLRKSKSKIEAHIIAEASSSNFNYEFKVREIINAMVNFGISDVDTFNELHNLRTSGIVFAINPRTKSLIDQFQPIINQVSKSERNIILRLSEGNFQLSPNEFTDESKKAIDHLIGLNLISNDLHLLQLGEVVVMLLNLIPDL